MNNYQPLTQELAQELEKIVGSNDFQIGEGINPDFWHDEMPIYGSYSPEAVVFPANTEEVSQIMKLCYDNDIPVTVRGAGTGLVGGCTPLHGGVVMCMMNMNQILEYDMKNFNVRVQPGVLLSELAADAEAHDLLYAPDPGQKLSSIGGNVSTNAGGMRAVKYGTTRDHVLAITAVMPNGEVLEIGRPVTKISSGYSLLHLIIGSEGTLAVITELTMKVLPLPHADLSLILPYEDLETAIETVPLIRMAGLDPRSIEFMERDIVDSTAEYTNKKVFPTEVEGREAGAYLLVTFDGSDEEELMARAEALSEIAYESGAFEVFVVDHPSQKADVWDARSSFLTVIESEPGLLDEMDVVVPPDKTAIFLRYVHDVGDSHGMRIRSFGHIGDGNLHIYCVKESDDQQAFLAESAEIMKAAYAKCEELGGAISGEHGIGYAKKQYLADAVGSTQMNLMAGIKQIFDPKGILNPGKVCTEL